MIRSTTVQYESLEFDVEYVLDEGCKGDWHTPPKQAEVTITIVLLEDINILDILDVDIVRKWEDQILQEML